MTRTAYVTGSTGFLGVNLVHALVEDGWHVIALRRRSSNTRDLNPLDIEQVEGDVLDLESLRRTLPAKVDAVFNVAADTSMWSRLNERQNRINIDGTRNIVQAALEKKVGRFIHTSSIGAFGNIHGPVISESTPSRGREAQINYYRSKYFSELEVDKGLAQGLDAVILNPAQIVGRFDYHYTPQMFDSLRRGLMPGMPRGSMVLGHARDYAHAHVAAFSKGRTGERYILGGVHASFHEVFSVIGELVNRNVPARPLPPVALNCIAYLLEKVSLLTRQEPMLTREKVFLLNHPLRVSSAKAERELGFTTCSLQEMFSDCYRWMQQAGLA